MNVTQADETDPSHRATLSSTRNAAMPLRIGLVGFESRSEKILRRLLETNLSGEFEIGTGDRADILLVDREGTLGEKALLELYHSTSVPLVVVADGAVQGRNIDWVVKPVQTRELLRAIGRAATRARERAAVQRRLALLRANRRLMKEADFQLRSAPDTRTAPVAAKTAESRATIEIDFPAIDEALYREARLPDAVRYDPGQYLQSILQAVVDEARRREQIVVLRGLGKDIVVFDHGRRIHCGLGEYRLRQLAEKAIDRKMLVFLLLQPGAIDHAQLERNACSAEALLWKAALWASRGRLPIGCNPDKPVSIARWPNLTRLPRFPHAVQLAALWHRQAISPRATAALLDVPPHYVFGFYSACLQLGLIREHGRPVVFRTIEQATDQGLLGRMLGYLRRKMGKS